MTIADEPTAPAAAPVSAEELAAKLAAKLCHDFMSPASGIVSGLDLLEDPSAKDMKDEAMALVASSARKLVDLLTFSRIAFGSYAGAEAFDVKELEGLSRGVFAHVRPDLEWNVGVEQMSKAGARALLNLMQISAGALATGGLAKASVRADETRVVIIVRAEGPRVRLHPEILSGLQGEVITEGLAGRWVQAYYLHAMITAAGGAIRVETDEGSVTFTAVVPA